MKSTFYEIKNLLIRSMEFEEGDGPQYQEPHSYDHAHFVAAGSIDVEVNGETTNFKAPGVIWIKAGLLHALTGSPGAIGLCIHALRSQDGSGEPLDPAMIPAGVTALSMAQPITVL